MGLNTNPYSNTPIKNLEYIQNKALVIAPFEITKSGLIDTDLMLDTPGTITMYFFRKNFNNIDKEPTAEQFKVVGTVADISIKLGLDITSSNISSSTSSSYYLGFTKISVIFKYDKNTGIRTIEKDNSLLSEDYIDIGIDSTVDLTTEDYFVICNVTKNTKATNTSFTESALMDYLFMIPSSECQEIITDFDILDANNKTINVKKYGTLGSGFVADNDTTIEPAYQADFFGDGSNIATYLFDGTARDLNGNYNGTTTNVTYGDGKVGQAAVFNGANSLSYSTLPTSLKTYKCLVTISCWARTTNSAGKTLINVGDSSKFIYGMTCSSFGMNLDNGVTSYVSAGISSTITDDIWHHYVGIYDGTTSYFYIDGILKATSSIVNGGNGGNGINGLNIGCLSTNYPASYFNGSIDQVRIFNRALNQNEVTALYLNNASTRVIKQESLINENLVTTGLIGNFKLNNSYKNLVNNLDFYSSNNMIGLTYDESDQSIESLISKSSYLKLNGLYSTNTVATISLWLKWYGGNDSSILRFGSYQIILDSKAGQFGFNTFNNDVYGINLNSYINKWVHLTIEFKTNSFGSIYINGVKQTLSQLRSTPAYSNAIVQGRDLIVLPGNYDGKIKELKMFNRLLTTNEVYQNYIGYEITSKPDFFKDGSNIYTYPFNGDCKDLITGTSITSTGQNYDTDRFNNPKGCLNLTKPNVSQYVLPFYPTNNSSPYSISGWFYFETSDSNTSTNSLLYIRAGTDLVITGNYSNGNITLIVGLSSGGQVLTAMGDYRKKWNHITTTYDGGNTILFINGIKIGSIIGTMNSGTWKNLIGSSLNYIFKIDSLRIFNRALNQREVLELYNEQPSYEEQLTLNEVTGKTLTPSGNPLVVYDKDNGPSIKFVNNKDYLTCPGSNDFAFGTGDFTIEAWVKFNNPFSTYPTQYLCGLNTTGGIGFGIESGNLAFGTRATAFEINFAWVPTIGVWYHLAATRENGIMKLWINGSNVASKTNTKNLSVNTGTFYIGALTPDLADNLYGNISQLNIIKGVAKYTAAVGNFTPASRLVQTSNTVLLLQVDKPVVNTDNWTKVQLESVETIPSSDMIEQTGKVLTNTGVTIDNNIYKNNIGSLYFNGINYITAPISNDFSFGTGDFTVESWVKFLTLTDYTTIVGTGRGNTTGWWIEFSNTRGITVYSNNILQFQSLTTIPSRDIWYHLAMTRKNGILKLFLNGLIIGSSNSNSTFECPYTLLVGAGTESKYKLNGFIDDLRIIKGQALYTENFTPPTTRLVKDANTVFLLQAPTLMPLLITDPKRKDFFGDKSMAACYMLDSNANDETGLYNGIIKGNNFVTAAGKFGQCVLVNSTNYVDLPETLSSLFGTNDFSISLWFKPSDILVTHNILFATQSSNIPGFFTILLMDNKILAGVFDGSARPSIAHQDNINLTDWNHVVVTKESNIYKIYSNNVVSSTTLTSTLLITCGDIRLGQNPAAPSSQYFNGQIDNVKIFNRALTDSEVTSLYNETISPIITLETETETIASEPDFFNDKSNIATYLFDNNVNDANDKYNGTGTGVTYAAGKFGQAIALTPSSTISAQLPNIAGASFSISMWVLDSSFAESFKSLWYYGDGSVKSGFTSYHTLANTIGIDLYGSQTYETPALTIKNEFIHVTWVISNPTLASWSAKIYINGVSQTLTQTRTSTNIPAVTGFLFGLNGYDNTAIGRTTIKVDNVRIFNRALTASEVQDLYKETKRVKYKAITLDETNFGPAAKFSIETQKEIKLLNYKTWTGSDNASQGYRIYPVMKIQDHTSEETSFSPKFYLGAKYQRNLAEVLLPSIKSKRTISNLKNMYLVDDLCIQTLKKINILLENNQLIKFTERLYNLVTPIKEKLNADLILEYLSTPVTGTSNNDIAETLKTSLIEDYNFTQEEIDNLNDNLNTFKSRARMNLSTPVIQGTNGSLDQIKFSLPKTFVDGNRSKTEKKNLLVFGTDAGFNKFGLSGYSAPYSNITKRDDRSTFNYSDLVVGLTTLSSLEDISTIKDVQQSYGDETLHILFENGNLYAGRYVDSNQSYQYNRDGRGFTKQSFPLKLINTNVKSMACLMYATFIIDNNNDVWALGGYSINGTSSPNLDYDIYGINSYGNYLPNWTKVFNSTPENTPKKVVGIISATWLLMESGEVFCTGYIPNYYTFDGTTKYTKTWTSIATGVKDINCGDYHIVYTMQNGDIYVGNRTNKNGVTTQGNNTTTDNTKALKIITTWIPTGQNITQIECTNENIYYLLSNGDVYGAGGNRGGQLQASPSSSTYGVSTPKKLYSNVKRIIPQLFGRNSICSVLMVELNTGEIKANGDTSDYKLGRYVDYNTGITTPVSLFSKVDKIFLTERSTIAIINGTMYLAGFNRVFGESTLNQTFLETKPLIALIDGFKDILTNYKQQIPFTYIPLSTNLNDQDTKPVFENLTDITGFNNSEIVIDLPNIL